MKVITAALCLWILYHFTSTFCIQQTDGFSVARIHSELSYNPDWEIAPLSSDKQKQIENILSQEFRYMACGGQCFAFSSTDDQYVIKFFKHRIRKPYSYFYALSLPQFLDSTRKRKLDKALFKMSRDFTSYKIAYDDLQDETGLEYIHLNKTQAPKESVVIIDKLGIKHSIKLDDIEFVVQKKADLVYPRFDELKKQADPLKIEQAMRSMIDVIVARCKKGYFDEDPKIHRNFGFTGDQPVIIDVGRFVRDDKRKEPSVYKADVSIIIKRLREWLEETHPELVDTLDKELYAFQNEN